jgi:hypothetical protein
MEENETSSVPKLIDYVINYGLKKTCFIKWFSLFHIFIIVYERKL